VTTLRTLSVAAAVAVILAWSSAAHAYVRYESAAGMPFGWKSSCVRLTAYPADIASMTKAQTSDAVAAAVASWSKQDPTLAGCSYLDLMLATAPDAAVMPPARNDGTNGIGFRQDGWCSRADPTVCYDPAALALTSVSARTSTGEILDADVEINAFNFTWADLAAGPAGGARDLQSAVTHEIGHLIGLDHTCYLDPSGGIPTDQNGAPIPSCANAPPAVQETTMFPTLGMDIGPRTLAADDRQGVCDIYPSASDPMLCPPLTPADAGADAAQMDAAQMDAAPDAVPPDAPADAGPGEPPKSGCGCEIERADFRSRPLPAVAVLLLVGVVRSRRRR
jgi:hypothetical protein